MLRTTKDKLYENRFLLLPLIGFLAVVFTSIYFEHTRVADSRTEAHPIQNTQSSPTAKEPATEPEPSQSNEGNILNSQPKTPTIVATPNTSDKNKVEFSCTKETIPFSTKIVYQDWKYDDDVFETGGKDGEKLVCTDGSTTTLALPWEKTKYIGTKNKAKEEAEKAAIEKDAYDRIMAWCIEEYNTGLHPNGWASLCIQNGMIQWRLSGETYIQQLYGNW